MIKYCWLNLETGNFSDSWTDATDMEKVLETMKKYMDMTHWKLIAYECITDEKFEFNMLMELK